MRTFIFINSMQNIYNKKFESIGIPPKKLATQFEKLGERRFRAKQVMKWIYSRNILDFEQMTDLPTELRLWLTENGKITLPETVEVARSNDGSAKFLFRLDDGKLVESVYIPDKNRDRNTICVSSQVGCKFDCAFCATGKMGFSRNLSSTEIIGQIYIVRQYIAQGGKNLTNIVFMGMGEPLDNLDAVVDSIEVLNVDVGFGIGHRKILVSTVGIPEQIEKLMNSDIKPKLAISLNAPNNRLRSKIMPINKKYPIENLFPLVQKYFKYSKRWVTFEYVMFAGINDSLKFADELVRLIKDLPIKVNLIPFNEIDGFDFKRPDDRIVMRFQSYLLANSLVVTIRQSKGRKIAGACGQLAGKEVLNSR